MIVAVPMRRRRRLQTPVRRATRLSATSQSRLNEKVLQEVADGISSQDPGIRLLYSLQKQTNPHQPHLHHNSDTQWSSNTRPSIQFSRSSSLTAGIAPRRVLSSQQVLMLLSFITFAKSFAYLPCSSFPERGHVTELLFVPGLRMVGAGESGDTGSDLSPRNGSRVLKPGSTKHLVGIYHMSLYSVVSASGDVRILMPWAWRMRIHLLHGVSNQLSIHAARHTFAFDNAHIWFRNP